MATRLTYTTGTRSAELDHAFEAALAAAREREPEPLAHLVGPHYVQQFARKQSRTIVEQ